MDERIHLFLMETGPVLCIDVGSHTQYAVLARPGQEVENWPAFSLPSPAQMISQRIRELTLLKRGIWLYGKEMGGGFDLALREHLAAELPTAATPEAVVSIHNDLDIVKGMGIQLSEICPKNNVPIFLADYNSEFWDSILKISNLPLPHMVLAAAKDHGNFSNNNRQSRMKIWQELLAANPNPAKWIYANVPENMSRLKSLQQQTGGPVADSAVCAILGALSDQEIMEKSYQEGITLINAGNTHTLAALVYQGKILGIYEHHTEKRGISLLLNDLEQFRNSWLSQEQVHSSGGNAVVFAKQDMTAGNFSDTFIMGPCRQKLKGHGKFIAPHGSHAHAGCMGLLYGWAHTHSLN